MALLWGGVEVHRLVVVAFLYVVAKFWIAHEIDDGSGSVFRPGKPEQGLGRRVGPFHLLVFVQDHQCVGDGTGRFSKTAGETHQAAFTLAAACLVMGDDAIDFPPEPGRIGWLDALVGVGEIHQLCQLEKVLDEVQKESDTQAERIFSAE